MSTQGDRIRELRERRKMTQEELARHLNISGQAISKWENDLSIPDISVLIELSELFNVSLDELLKDKKRETALVDEKLRKPFEEMILKIIVESSNGDKVKVNLPLPLVKMGLEMGMKFGDVANKEELNTIDFAKVLEMVDVGLVGKLIEVETKEGDVVKIFVE